jgi:plastocyanin
MENTVRPDLFSTVVGNDGVQKGSSIVGIAIRHRRTIMFRTFSAVAAAAVCGLALAGTSPAAPAAKTVQGSVGPGFTINLAAGGRTITKLKKGVLYRFVINDRSSIHDFHLTGPGINRMLTSVDFTGTKSFVLTLRKGVYRYFCDPHAAVMHGSFRVV